MKLTNEFVVPVSIDETWNVLQDLEAIAPCLPGAQVESVDGDDFLGVVKVKLGPVSTAYRGMVSFVEKDAEKRVAVLKAAAREARGGGNVKAQITASLTECESGGTLVLVETDLAVTGRAAQFGGGVMADVSGKMFDQFAQRLSQKIESANVQGERDLGQVRQQAAQMQQTEALELASVVPWRRVVVFGAVLSVFVAVLSAIVRRNLRS